MRVRLNISLETLRKLCFSTEIAILGIRWNYGVLWSVSRLSYHLTKCQNDNVTIKLIKENKGVNSPKVLKLIEITIANKLSSKKHISNLFNITSHRFRVLMRIRKYLSTERVKLFLEAYHLSTFKYFPLIRIICSKTANNLISNVHKLFGLHIIWKMQTLNIDLKQNQFSIVSVTTTCFNPSPVD